MTVREATVKYERDGQPIQSLGLPEMRDFKIFSLHMAPARVSFAAILILAASQILISAPALAVDAGSSGTDAAKGASGILAGAPSCGTLEERCVKRVQRMTGAVSNSTETVKDIIDAQRREHRERHHRDGENYADINGATLTLEGCFNSYHKARHTGVWPEHIPFNFAMACSN